MSSSQLIKENNFFSTLSAELWKIDKHPFLKIGQPIKNQGSQLSYNPSRVFKQEGDEQKHFADPQYLQFERQQFENEIEVHNELLRKDIQKKHNDKMARVSELDFSRQKPYNVFKFDRGKCGRCDRCQLYHGNFNLDVWNDVDLFECNQCRCPMNSHPIITRDATFSKLLYGYLLSKDLNQNHLNVDTIVCAFSLDKSQLSNHSHIKRLVQILNEGGYSVLSTNSIEEWEFKHKLVEQRLFERVERCIDKYSFDEYLHFFRAMAQLPVDPRDLDFRDESQSIRIKIQRYTSLRDSIDQAYGGLGDSRIQCLLIRRSQAVSPLLFYKFIKAVELAIQPYALCYYSPERYWAAVDSQLFFPSFFRINYETMMVPNSNKGSVQNLAASDKVKDLLDFNNFIVVRDDFENMKRIKLENAFMFSRNSFLLNYILGQNVVSQIVPQFGMKIVAKIGPPHLHDICRNTPNIIRIKDQSENEQIQKQLCPELLCSQRCAFVLRPSLAKSGMDELILNYFRLNNFTVISRVFVKLSVQDLMFFALIENINEEETNAYMEMMGSGMVEIILVSKRAAIHEANFLNQGCLYSLRQNSSRLIKETPCLNVTVNGKSYKEEVAAHYQNGMLGVNIASIFNGVKSLFDLQQIILGEREQQNPIVVDSSDGRLIRHQNQTFSVNRDRVGPKLTEAILKELNSDTFNYWLYTSTSETITQQIVSQFMPECEMFESVCVIIKPGFTHLAKLIKSHLELLKYKIIADKTVLLSKNTASNLVNALLVLRLDPEMRANLIAKYSSEKVEILCLAKPSGRREMLSYLTGFTLSQPGVMINIEEPINDIKLKMLLVPIWNAEPLVLQVLSNVLYSIEDALKSITVLSQQDQYTVLNYLCGSMLGVTIDSLPFQTSLGQLTYYQLEQETDAKLQSWYYATINRLHPHYVPLLFQYRVFGSTVFCLQSHNGQEFIQHVLDSYIRENVDPDERKKRGSMVLYLWAKRLAQMVGALSQVQSQLNGYGLVGKYGSVFRGEITEENFITYQTKRINKFLADGLFTKHKDIAKTLNRLLALRGFLDRSKKQNKRLLPTLREDSLRIIKTSQLTRLHMLDKFQLIDPSHELSNAMNMSTVCLFNIKTCLQPKYSFFSKVYIDLLKYSSLSKDYGKPLRQLLDLFVQLYKKSLKTDLEMLSVEVYLEMVKLYAEGEKWLLQSLLQGLPSFNVNLGKLSEAPENTSGKKRKFIEKKQYHANKDEDMKPAQYHDAPDSEYVYNVYGDKPAIPKNALFDPADPQHSRWANETRMINLVREADSQKESRKGVNVQFEKKISENEELVKEQVNKQVQKYVEYNEEEFLYQTGIQKHVWYRRVKGQEKVSSSVAVKPKPKLDQALDKQVSMFLNFKKQNPNSQQ